MKCRGGVKQEAAEPFEAPWAWASVYGGRFAGRRRFGDVEWLRRWRIASYGVAHSSYIHFARFYMHNLMAANNNNNNRSMMGFTYILDVLEFYSCERPDV